MAGFGNGTDIHAILPVYHSGTSISTAGPPVVGQLVLTVTPEFGHPLQLFDAERADQNRHAAVGGEIRPIDPSKDFRPKNRLPILRLKLGECEELLAVRAKARRCVVLAVADGIPDNHLPVGERNKARNAFQRPSYLVAPAYSVSTPAEPRAMTVTIAARAECLVYPQLVFLPRSGGIIQQDSVVRLDRAFWTTLSPPSQLYAAALSDIRMSILQGQLQVLRGEEPGKEYLEMVELLRGELAEAHAQHLP
ncbi:hypothetical protein [Dyella sp.]|uniref:hypothetical protein n=1 Tax=Dyella sp. TaxID=1869338 RepID=UPI002ED0F988